MKRLLSIKKKSVEDVAALGEIEPKQVYRVINAEHSATLSVIVAIAKGLEVHPKKLFDFEIE